MKKLFFIIFYLIFAYGGHSVQANTIKHFNEITGLCDLTQAFFRLPECKYDFRSQKARTRSVMPSPTNKGIEAEVLNEATKAFLTTFKSEKNCDFFIPKRWHMGRHLDIDLHTKMLSDATTRYVQKLRIPAGATVCFLGDIHGSVHALMRILWRLVALGHLDETLKINDKNFYIVTLGDYVDRGRWSVEVVTTLMFLKLQNWHNYFPVVGNHETGRMAVHEGFFEEIYRKFSDPFKVQASVNKDELRDPEWLLHKLDRDGDVAAKLFNGVNNRFFKKLPVALFIECDDNVVQCCHGGIEPSYYPINFLENYSALYEAVGPEHNCLGLFWNDSCQSDGDGVSTRGYHHIVAGRTRTLEYLQHNNIKHLMRAHQDQQYGFKVFFADPFAFDALRQKKHELLDPKSHPVTYPSGPYYWLPVFKNLGITSHTFNLNLFAHYPVFTLTTCAEPRAFPYDCFGLMKTESVWDDWMFEIYELFLGRNGTEADREGKFVRVSRQRDEQGQSERNVPSGPREEDPIGVSWHDTFDSEALENGFKTLCAP